MNQTVILKKRIALLLAGLMVLAGASCKRSSKSPNSSTEGRYGYRYVEWEVPLKEGYIIGRNRIFYDGEAYCVAVGYAKTDEKIAGEQFITDIYSVNEDGELTYTLEIATPQIPNMVKDDTFAFIGSSKEDMAASQDGSELSTYAVFVDRKNGLEKKAIPTDYQATDIVQLESGFALTGFHTIELYDENYQRTARIDAKDVTFKHDHAIIEENGQYFAVVETQEESEFYALDFATGKVTKKASAYDIDGGLRNQEGKYYFNRDAEYKIDLLNMQTKKLADFSEINVRPAKKPSFSPEYIPLDDEHFARKYDYFDGTKEILFFQYDSSIEYTSREKITIGGFGGSNAALEWAIYLFNIENDEYRAVYVDFSDEFGWHTPQDAQMQTVRMIKYFQEGNAPDIFYGQVFDYNYMGRSRMVIDMLPYMENDVEFSFDDFSPSIASLLSKDGHCYQVFGSYWLNGYRGEVEYFGENPDITLSDMDQKAEELEIPAVSMATPGDIVAEAIMYDFPSFWASQKADPAAAKANLQSMITIALKHGITEQNRGGGAESLLDIYSVGSIRSLQDEGLSNRTRYAYMGFPSLTGSVHVLNSESLVAISTSSKHPEVCWQLIRQMFSDEVQKMVVAGGRIPVKEKWVEEMCACAMDPARRTIPEWTGLYSDDYEATPEEVEDFRRAIRSVDAICAYDWRLFNIIVDEMQSFYSQNRSVEQIAASLYERLNVYYDENYG